MTESATTTFFTQWQQIKSAEDPCIVDVGTTIFDDAGRELPKLRVQIATVQDDLDQEGLARVQAKKWAESQAYDIKALDQLNQDPVELHKAALRIYHAFKAPDDEGNYNEDAFPAPEYVLTGCDSAEMAMLLRLYDIALIKRHPHLFDVSAEYVRGLQAMLCELAGAEDDTPERALAGMGEARVCTLLTVFAKMWQSDVEERDAEIAKLKEQLAGTSDAGD